MGLKHKGRPVPIVRIDISLKGSSAILQKEDIQFDSVPRVVIVRDGKFYSYDSPYDRLDLLIHHLNRLLNPVVVLQTEEEVERFLGLEEGSEVKFWHPDYNTTFLRQLGDKIPDVTGHWDEQMLKTRAVCFLYDKQEYIEELNHWRRDSRFLSTRDNLRMGLVDNQRLVRKLKAGKYGPKLFPPVSMSSLVLRRYDGMIKLHDVNTDDFVSPHFWVNKHSIKEVEELNTETYRIMELIRQPMFLAFVDFLDPRWQKDSYKAVQVLKEVAPKYSHVVSFFHVNNTMFW
jgi:hypothetical protein